MKRLFELLQEKEVGEMVEITEEVKAIIDEIAQKEEERKEKEKAKREEKRKENEPLKQALIEAMQAEPDRIFKAKELAEIVEISTQKATPLLKEMAQDELIIREQEKKSQPFTYRLNK